jgi:curved DNA-binding protein CbpA
MFDSLYSGRKQAAFAKSTDGTADGLGVFLNKLILTGTYGSFIVSLFLFFLLGKTAILHGQTKGLFAFLMKELADNLVLRVKPEGDISNYALSAEEGFVLSQIDGQTPVVDLVTITGLGGPRTKEILARLFELELVRKSDTATGSPSGARQVKISSGSGAAAKKKPAISITDLAADMDDFDDDDERELTAGEKRDIEVHLQFANNEDYYSLLGLKRDATEAEIKKAFFSISKKFHPDRFFIKQIGDYEGKLNSVFKKVNEAYEILKDQESRLAYLDSIGTMASEYQEIARSAEEDSVSGAKTASAPAVQRPVQPVRPAANGPRVPGLPPKISEELLERISRAKKFWEAGKKELLKNNFQGAVSSFKLAIAFDPFNEQYKKDYEAAKEGQKIGDGEQLLKKVQFLEDLGKLEDAALIMKEAISFAPGEPKFLHKMATLLYKARRQSKLAIKLARRASASDANNQDFLRTLANLYIQADQQKYALRELEKLRKLDKKNSELKREIKRLKKSLK